jgi:nicotinate-nucleotide adenylyltransferase
LGGTLDPIHVGHLAAARAALEQLDLDEVLLVPAGQPWQKGGQVFATAPDRLTMAQLSLDDEASLDPSFPKIDDGKGSSNYAKKMVVSDVDVRRPGPTYTADTLVDVRREEPPSKWWFIVGVDAFAKVPTWHNAERLGGLARFAVVPRPGFDPNVVKSAQDEMAARSAPIDVDFIDMAPIDVSSTRIRDSVATGISIKGLVSDSVAAYIDQHGLYH